MTTTRPSDAIRLHRPLGGIAAEVGRQLRTVDDEVDGTLAVLLNRIGRHATLCMDPNDVPLSVTSSGEGDAFEVGIGLGRRGA